MGNLCVILRDQLSHQISSINDFCSDKDSIFMCETYQDCTYVKHHKKKLVFILSAMRHFADELKNKKYNLNYVKLDDSSNTGTISSEIKRFCSNNQVQKIIITWPGEYWVLQELVRLKQEIKIPVEIREDDRFLAEEFTLWAKNRKELRMEIFYRKMRQKYNILMFNGSPVGGKWNYDAENRKFPKNKLKVPQTYTTDPDAITTEVMQLVSRKFSDHFGDTHPFHFAVTRNGALEALELFIEQRLSSFGDYQDAMVTQEPWMYHAHISFYLNIGLLLPLECIKLAEKAYYDGKVSINSAEGFIRQILGWREYVRGIYWLKMPEYKNLNFFDADRRMPDFYWSGDTKMNCLKHCVTETKNNAYAHHIQRLMVLGNFALIAGIHPDYVNEWYLVVYADAYEWVELPNVTGMILFADGGYLASKPYAASGAYINKMSNYCTTCHYKVNEKNGNNACPFNYLYWDFLMRNYDQLAKNNRLSIAYSALKKMNQEKIDLIRSDAKNFLSSLKYY
jgi:deoxyribodipyrimidine photolyase-related protein